MSPCCLESFSLLEQGVGDNELMLRTELQKRAPVAIAVANSVPLLRLSLRYGVCLWSQLAAEGYAGRDRKPLLLQFQLAEYTEYTLRTVAKLLSWTGRHEAV